MISTMVRCIRGSLLAATLIFISHAAAAEDYPNRPIRIVAPLAPGGAVDILARLVGEKLSPAYRQPVIVENKPGASGHVGAQSVAKAPGDGYTLMVGTIGIHAAYASYRKLTYSPATELQPIVILGEAPNVVLVPANSPYKTFGDFLADAQKRPGQLSYASAGNGSSIHMVTALFEQVAGTQLNHVPYRGSAPALVDLVGGRIDVMFENMSSGIAHVRSGKLRALAITSSKRNPQLPDVPTIAEAGLPGYSGTSWFTLAAPMSMPRELAEKISRDVTSILRSGDAVARLESLGISFAPNTPGQAAEFIQSETVKWNRVIKAANLQLD